VWKISEIIMAGRNKVIKEKPVSMSICPAKTPHGLAWV
jgi:hypothetical protein